MNTFSCFVLQDYWPFAEVLKCRGDTGHVTDIARIRTRIISCSIVAVARQSQGKPMAKHTTREELSGVIAFIGFIWCVYFIGYVLGWHLESYGVTPRTLHGLV